MLSLSSEIWVPIQLTLELAAITTLSLDMPFASSTRRSIRLAPGATPLKVLVKCGPVEDAPLLATIPATCVPWP